MLYEIYFINRYYMFLKAELIMMSKNRHTPTTTSHYLVLQMAVQIEPETIH